MFLNSLGSRANNGKGYEGELMRLGSVILAIWLIIGAIAAGQRGYYGSSVTCAHASTVFVTILAGPLNYIGANPKVTCH
jgi:hypothetical protein